jgi:hypothetical protein
VTRLRQLQQAGVSIWLDILSRDLLDSGEFTRLVDRGATGARYDMNAKNGSSTAPVANMWCAHTVIDSPAIAIVAKTSPL